MNYPLWRWRWGQQPPPTLLQRHLRRLQRDNRLRLESLVRQCEELAALAQQFAQQLSESQIADSTVDTNR